LVFGCAGSDHFAVRGDYLARHEVVDGHSVLATQPADTTAQGQAADTCLGHYPARNCKTEDMGFAIQIAKSGAALCANSSIGSVDVHRAHSGKIDDKTVVAERTAAHVVASAANRGQQIVLPSEPDGSNDVRNPRALGDQAGTFVNTGIPDPAGLAVAGVCRLEKPAVKLSSEGWNVDRGYKCRHCPISIFKLDRNVAPFVLLFA